MEPGSQWKNYIKYDIKDKGIKKIEYLDKLKTYLLRVIVIANKNEGYEDDLIPFVLCKTTCLEITDNYFTIEVKNTSANLTIKVDLIFVLMCY